MILGQISYLDCLVFVLFLIPQLLLRVSIFELLATGIKAIPHLSIYLNNLLSFKLTFLSILHTF
jgi:hypothetical protein